MGVIKKALDRLLATVCVLLFGVLVATVSWQVFSRQVLGSPSGWSEELAKYIFVWLGLFGAALVFSERGHIAVDLAVRKLPRTGQRAVGVLVELAVMAFALLALVVGGWRMTLLTWDQTLTSLPLAVGMFYLVMPVIGVVILCCAAAHLVAHLRGDLPAAGPGGPSHDTTEEL